MRRCQSCGREANDNELHAYQGKCEECYNDGCALRQAAREPVLWSHPLPDENTAALTNQAWGRQPEDAEEE